MKTLIIYRSKTGFTRRYAQWIQEALGCECLAWEEAQARDLAAYDTLIYGAGFHAGMISGVKKFLQMAAGKGTNIAVFVTGAYPPDAPEVSTALRQNFTDEQWAGLRAFYFQSGLCYEKLGLVDKTMMKIFRTMLKKQNGEDDPMYRLVQQSSDLCDPAAIQPLVDYVRSL